MQAILTTYFGPTNFRDSRIRAKADAGTRWYPYDHALSIDGNHRAAARAFADEFGWLTGKPEEPIRHCCTLRSGTLPTKDHAHVLVFLDPAVQAEWEGIRTGWDAA